ncbi:MAG TPA: tetratricopeptide repeat protein [Thermoanaerobaculia bacterium]|nr:tetratricopeptide repeat protein [Thermoanaerobaculia bacterium]
MTQATAETGEVITFYSYKGGTGRTMALVNVGCVLAQTLAATGSGDVLLIDWDLEAPGLHHYLPPNRIAGDGLLELFAGLLPRADQVKTREEALDLLRSVPLEHYVSPTAVPGLFVLPAGRFDASYGSRVNAFSWEALFNASPPLLPAFAELLGERYAYTLVDSRTGTTDVSGICTTIMPSKLVVVFTPNRQSLTGIFDLVRRAPRYRRESNDWRPLAVFPLPSRIEQAREELLRQWRYGSDGAPAGYQPSFEALFREVYDLPECDLSEYFTEVQIQHVPDYAYGEQIAVLVETESRLSLKRSYEEFTKRLRILRGPWEDPATVEDEAEIERRLAEVQPLLERRDATRAFSALHSTLEIYYRNSKTESPELRDLLAKTASALRAEGKISEALELTTAALAAERREGGANEASLLIALADLLKTLGRLEEARSVAGQAYTLASELGQQRSCAAALEVLADIEQTLGQHDRAAGTFAAALEARSGAGEGDLDSAMLQLRLAQANAQAGRVPEARQALESMYGLLRNADRGDIRSAELLRSAAGVAEAVNQLEVARELLAEAMRIQSALLGHRAPELADTIEQLGNVLLKANDPETAMKHFQDVYFRRSSNLDRSDPAVIGILRKIGLVAWRLGDLSTARDRYEDALENAQTLPRTHTFHITLRRQLAEVCIEMKEFDRALALVSEALAIAREIESPEVLSLRALRAGINADRGDFSLAKIEFNEAIDQAQRSGLSMPEAHVRVQFARRLLASGDVAAAKEQYVAARGIYAAAGREGAAAAIEREMLAADKLT